MISKKFSWAEQQLVRITYYDTLMTYYAMITRWSNDHNWALDYLVITIWAGDYNKIGQMMWCSPLILPWSSDGVTITTSSDIHHIIWCSPHHLLST